MADRDDAYSQSTKIELLCKKHDRDDFSCGDDTIDSYFIRRASQDAKKKIATTFVLINDQSNSVTGYYTLSATSIKLVHLPVETSKKLPKYPHIPATLLGRLAIDRRYQGRGYGGVLLIDALRRALQATTEVASFAVVVDAINERARTFYEQYGFAVFPDHKRRLFLPMKTIADLFS